MVVSDTSPLNYLVQVELVQVVPALFGRLLVPAAVLDELRHAAAPESVRRWSDAPPDWLEVSPAEPQPAETLRHLGRGERAAIALCRERDAQLLIVDDKVARRAADAMGVGTVGTLGVLVAAADRGLCERSDAIRRLRSTSFRAHPSLLDAIERGD